MKSYSRKIETVAVDAVKDITCNFCGGRVRVNKFGVTDEHLSAEKRWGYGSPYDGETHNIDICMPCYEKLLGMMKIPPADVYENQDPDDTAL